MPIWLRKFTFRKIQEYYEKQADQSKKQQKTPKPAFKPGVTPSYSTKASS